MPTSASAGKSVNENLGCCIANEGIKKRKKKESCTFSVKTSRGVKNNITCPRQRKIDGISSSNTSATIVALRSSQLNTHSSSSGSIENNKPTRKLGRFDSSSSDGMSTEADAFSSANTSSSGIMDIGVNADQMPPEFPLTVSFSSSMASKNDSQRGSRILKNDSGVSSMQHTPQINSFKSSLFTGHSFQKDTVWRDSPMEVTTETLRWEEELSDEEMEKERIEVYKENRRKRYDNALVEKKTKSALHHSKSESHTSL